ncbi:MAG: hypothetical protein RL518_266 [Pseudomonadota bacterium]|jgi:hypothetical protein
MNDIHHSHGQRALHVNAKVSVVDVVSSRYGGTEDGERPLVWEERREGLDVVRIEGGETIALQSSAMQSTPKPGWTLVLTGGSHSTGYTWTLYGITPRH